MANDLILGNTTATPAVSVVVPCRNERDFIEGCVRSILAQEPPHGGFELIVVDGMSDDGSREILEELERRDARLEVIDNPEHVTSYGMNAGIRRARGRYIAIMGAHNRYASDYLRSGVEVLQQTGADNVGGSMQCEGASRVQKAIAAAHHSPFAVGGARWHNTAHEGPADTVFGGIYRREVFDRIGLFDEELVRNQDDELNLRLARSGGKIWQSPRIKSWYVPRNSLKALLQQYLQYGYWKVRVIQKHRMPASIRHLVPGCFVASLIVLTPAAFWSPVARWGLFTILLIYSLCNLIASLLTTARHGWRILPVLPVVFACYHLGYGFGFVRGVVDFILLKRRPSSSYTKLTRPAAQHVASHRATNSGTSGYRRQ